MEELNLSCFLRACVRLGPALFLVGIPLQIPYLLRIVFVFPLALVLAQMLSVTELSAVTSPWVFDLLLGLGVGTFLSLFLSAAMKVSVFLVERDDEEEEGWSGLINALVFAFLVVLLMSLRIERDLLRVLSLQPNDLGRANFFELGPLLLHDFTWLSLKVASLGLLYALIQVLFGEVYRRIGGDSMKLLFAALAWCTLILLSPVLMPGVGSYLTFEFSAFWSRWLGAFH